MSENRLFPEGTPLFVLPEAEACSITTPGDCLPGGGGTVGDWITHWKEELEKMSINDITDFFKHFGKEPPEEVKNSGPDFKRLISLMDMDEKKFCEETFNAYNANITDCMKIGEGNKIELDPDKIGVVLGNYFNQRLPENERQISACSVIVSTGLIVVATLVTSGVGTILTASAPALGAAACTLIYS